MAGVWSDSTTLVWQDAVASNADTFNVYRGSIGDLVQGDLGSCLANELLSPTAQDDALPSQAEAWTYLVTGVNAASEGTLGFGSSSSSDPRPNSASCP